MKGALVNEDPLYIVVIGRHVEVSDALRDLTSRKAGRLGRFLAGMERAEVSFSRSPIGHLGDPFTCEIVLEGHGHTVRAAGAGGRPVAALDAAVDKAELQLTRLKAKLVERSRPHHGNGKRPAPATSSSPDDTEATEDQFEGITEP